MRVSTQIRHDIDAMCIARGVLARSQPIVCWSAVRGCGDDHDRESLRVADATVTSLADQTDAGTL